MGVSGEWVYIALVFVSFWLNKLQSNFLKRCLDFLESKRKVKKSPRKNLKGLLRSRKRASEIQKSS